MATRNACFNLGNGLCGIWQVELLAVNEGEGGEERLVMLFQITQRVMKRSGWIKLQINESLFH